MNLVHPYFYLAISILLCIVIGYVASLFFPAPTALAEGLTIYSDTPAEAAPHDHHPWRGGARAIGPIALRRWLV